MSKKTIFIALIVVAVVAGFFIFFLSNRDKGSLNTTELPPIQKEASKGEAPAAAQYLAIQIFTGGFDSQTIRQNIPPAESITTTVDDIIRAIGTVGSKSRKLGFIPGPLAFDNTDDKIRQLMRDSFAIALQNNIAVGFHIDDSMFWGRLSYLNKTENIEWLDWNKTPNTGRRLDWSSKPTKIMPQLCLNSPAVKDEVKKRAGLISEEVKRGLEMLKATQKEHLFLGIIAGWETQIGRDFDTGKYLGYCALTNKGYSAKNPPADLDGARADIVKDFIDFWAKSLTDAGVPDGKIFAHIAFIPKVDFEMTKLGNPDQKLPGTYLELTNFTPPSVSFGPHHFAGFSTYTQMGKLEEFQAERAKNGNPPWASSEGTAGDPGAIEKGDAGSSMESYLGNMFNHGAVLVNIFGWGVGPSSNPFRKIAENQKSIAAYQKFLHGEKLQEETPAQVPSPEFFSKMRKLQQELPPYLKEHGDRDIGSLYDLLNKDLKDQRYTDAEKNIDEILKIIEK